jgi:SpoIID/LytB domain protein
MEARAQQPPLPENARIFLPGHGWGHGRGMGQWGAKGLADQGKTYTQILSTYYPGTTLGTRSATEDIRVLVETSSDVIVSSDQTFTARFVNGTVIATSDSTYRYFKATWDGTNYHLYKSAAWNGSWTLLKTTTSIIQFKPGAAMIQLYTSGGSIHVYRGFIEAHQSGASINALNILSMQQYLYGVVPRESPASWPAEELKAQAVAARTYAARRKDSSRAAGNSYDICITSSCQSYGGYGTKSSPTSSVTVLESQSTNDAIDGTAGKILTYNGSPILAEYSSSTGGYTAASSLPYQKAVPDPTDSVSPHHDWTASMTVSEIEARWPSIGRLVDLTVTQRNGYGQWGGRVLQMNIVGTNATTAVTGYGFMNAFAWPGRSDGLQGNWFTPLYWRGTLQSAPSSVALYQGETKTIGVRIMNSGSASWPVGGNVHLATYSASAFATSSWITSTRPTSVTRNVTDPSRSTVAPGQVAEFDIPLTAGTLAPGAYSQRFSLIADNQSVTSLAFTVGIEVLVPWVQEAPNLLTNGSFEPNSYGWTGTNLGAKDGVTAATFRDGSRSFHLTGAPAKSITQTISFGGERSATFSFGGWNRADASNPSGGPIALAVTARYSDGTTSNWRLAYPGASHGWSYRESPFTTAAKPLSALTVSASLANQTGDIYFDAIRLEPTGIRNHSFEDGLAGWAAAGLSTGDGASTADKRDGASALFLTGATGSKSVSQTVPISGARYEQFVFGASNKAAAPWASGGAIAATLTLNRTDGTSQTVGLHFDRQPHDWSYMETAVRSPVAFTSATLTLSATDQTGSIWFDDVRLSRSWISNPSFESGLSAWRPINLGSSTGVVSSSPAFGAHSLAFTGSGFQVVQQSLPVSGRAGRRFIVSGWNRNVGTSSSGGRIDLTLRFQNTDGTTSWVSVPMPRTSHPWIYVEGVVTAPKTFSSVIAQVVFENQVGTASFDGVEVHNL